MRATMVVPKKIRSRDGKHVGLCTGGTRHCALEGCTGRRVYVRWPDGNLTYPCSKGMKEITPDLWQIV